MTDLEKTVKEGKRYWLGPIVAVHTIGEYALVEYKEKVFAPNPDAGTITDRSCFSIFIDGVSTRHSAPSLDQALVAAIAYKYEGPNTRANIYFERMIDMKGIRP